MTASGQVTWFPGRTATDAICPLCGWTGASEVVVSTPDLQSGRPVDYLRCGGCASVWPLEMEPFPYPDDEALWRDPDSRLVVHHALELVSGLTRQVRLVESCGVSAGSSVLEVGCNVGVLAAYMVEMWQAEVEGVEPSIFGEMARLAFGVEVHRAPLSESLRTHAEEFDAIVAIEVVEHVEDPAAFLVDVRRRLGRGGFALLTTPAAESLDETIPDAVALGVLSVGSHNFIYSQAQFERDLLRAGFEHVSVQRNGPELIARAGRPILTDVDDSVVEERVRQVRDRRRPTPDADPRVELGLAIDRYLTHRNHDPASAGDIERSVEEALHSVLGIDVRDLDQVVNRIVATTNLIEYGRVAPFRLGEFLYWRGQRPDLSERDRTSLWEAALVIIDHGLRIDPQNLGPLLPALGPPVVALGGRQPGRYRPLVRDAVASSPHDVVRTLVEPSLASRARASARSAARRLRPREPLRRR